MPSDNINELYEYLNQIADSTRTGSIEWDKANPTTYMWKPSGPERVKVVLQRIEKKEVTKNSEGKFGIRKRNRLVLQITKGLTDTVAMSVDGDDDEKINNTLESLYEDVAASITRRGLDLLKSILPPKKE